MPVEIPRLLEQTAPALCRALESTLPTLSESWWETCVVAKLSFQQRQHVERRNITQLDQLDLAAFIRIVDQNWYELANARSWPYEGRNFVREMKTVRNRWAHSQVASPPPEDVYRDLDTLHRFLTMLCPQDGLTVQVEMKKKALLNKQPERNPQPPIEKPAIEQPTTSTRFSPGDLVRLRANPEKSGAVTAVHLGETEPRYQVFMDGKVGFYYETQLLPAESVLQSDSVVPLAEASVVNLQDHGDSLTVEHKLRERDRATGVL